MARRKKQPSEPRYEPSESAKKIAALRHQIEALEHEICVIEGQMLERAARVVDRPVDGLVFGSHVCHAPDNVEHRCVLDEGDEFYDGDCVFCGGPEDRQ